MLPLYALVEEKIRGRWDVRKADKMNAFPHGGRWPRPRPRPDEGQACVVTH